MREKKILIVDDDQDLLRGMKIRLRANGYQVVVAVDALSAISVARKERPDLIILDLGLPCGDGFKVMERLSNIMPVAHIPIIILSARDPASSEKLSLEAGAEAFFQKPVDNEVLLQAIKNALGE